MRAGEPSSGERLGVLWTPEEATMVRPEKVGPLRSRCEDRMKCASTFIRANAWGRN